MSSCLNAILVAASNTSYWDKMQNTKTIILAYVVVFAPDLKYCTRCKIRRAFKATYSRRNAKHATYKSTRRRGK